MRPLHLVDIAPPWQSGYTVRTHQIALAQHAIGMEPAVAARPSRYLEPGHRALRGGVSVLREDGVTYYRRTEEWRLSRWFIHASQYLVARNVRGARRFRQVFDLPADPWEGFLESLPQRFMPTVVHAHTPAANFDGAKRLARLLGIPTVYEVRGFWDLPGPGRPADALIQGFPVQEWRDRETLAALEADAVITLGTAMRDELVRRGVPENKIHIIGNGVDAHCFQPHGRKDSDLVAELGLQGRYVLGYVTTVDPWEGIDTVLAALRELRHDTPEVVFVLVGSGPELARLRQLVGEWDLNEQVRFVGRVPHTEVRRYYSLFDAFVVPRTNNEVCRIVTPLKPLEAMAQEIPTIVSDLPALRELVEPGVRGWSFAPGDAGDLVRTVRQIAQEPEQVRRLAAQARDWVINERLWKHLATLTQGVYGEILGTH